MKRLVEVLAVAVIGLFLFLLLGEAVPPETTLRDYVVERGVAETGAVNLVTAIYLAYRAFDTLGETVVLLLAVSGVTFLVGKTEV